jgi:hypothetical protein
MPSKASRFGALSIGIEGLASGVYCVLRIREHLDPEWTRDVVTLSGTNKYLGQASILMLAGAVVVALVAMAFDKDRLLGILALCSVVPILVLMAGFQGIW